jgi:hypothetical protein
MKIRESQQAAPEEQSAGTEFTLPTIHEITEANWEEMVKRGVTVLMPRVHPGPEGGKVFGHCQVLYGVRNVVYGDAFDEDSQRPLRHMPGFGIYVTREGLAYNDHVNKALAWLKETNGLGTQPSGSPQS